MRENRRVDEDGRHRQRRKRGSQMQRADMAMVAVAVELGSGRLAGLLLLDPTLHGPQAEEG